MKRPIYGIAAFGLLIPLPGPARAQYDYTTLDVPGAILTVAIAINDAGQIVGRYTVGGGDHGFLLDVDGSYTTLDVPGVTGTQAWGINDNGQVVGQAAADGRNHGFLATPVP
jgi:hypothetical protein